MQKMFDIVGLGNAIVDILAQTDDDFLLREKLHKGSMALIDEPRAHYLYKSMGPVKLVSGGSAANTIVGAASLGAKTAFVGKVKEDELGQIFSHDLKSMGIHFSTIPANAGSATARCFVLVTPDGERTMNTYLGASQTLSPDDVDESLISQSTITYLEGYLWDPPEAKKAFLKATEVAHQSGGQVALTLSDTFCVDRYRDEFLELLKTNKIDILFANQHELKSLFLTSDFDIAVTMLQELPVLAAVTRSEHGVMVVDRNAILSVPAYPVDRLVDTTGAGDLFAAGFLTGFTRGSDHANSARLGAMAAAEVIQHIGARPESDLKIMANENGLLTSELA